MSPAAAREIARQVLEQELLPDALVEAMVPDRHRRSSVWLELLERFGSPAHAVAVLLRDAEALPTIHAPATVPGQTLRP